MRRRAEVCVDAGLAIKVVVTEPDSASAEALFHEWEERRVRMIAPPFFEAEADSILRKKVVLRGELTLEDADSAFSDLQGLAIHRLSIPGQRERAWEIARDFGFPTVYDATYLALAELRRCDFWTADERLFNRVKDRLAFVRLLAHYAS